MDPSNLLEYGALGVVVIMILLAFKIGYDWLKSNGERVSRQDDWMRQLVEADRLEREEHLQAWKLMVRDDIDSRQKLNGSLDNLCVVLEATAKEGKEERSLLGEILERMTKEGREQRSAILTLLENEGE